MSAAGEDRREQARTEMLDRLGQMYAMVENEMARGEMSVENGVLTLMKIDSQRAALTGVGVHRVQVTG